MVEDQAAQILGMEPIGILGRVDGVDRLLRVETAGKRELEQDPIDGFVGVEARDQLDQLFLGDVGRQRMVKRLHPDFMSVAPLAGDIDTGSRVVTNQDGGEAGRPTKRPHPRSHLDLDGGSNRLSVDDQGWHECGNATQ